MDYEKQKQEVGEGSRAIQSGRDTNINHGLSTGDMRVIMETMADQLPKLAAIATSVVEARLKEFREQVLGKFEEELAEQRRAFEDPDFQMLLGSAQTSYGRSGNQQTCENLINLIGERSKLATHSRLALSVNAAVEKAGVLTRNEFAELSYTFFFRNVRKRGVNKVNEVAAFLNEFANPLLSDLSDFQASYSYLEALGCAKISVGSISLEHILARSYPNLFCKPFTIEAINSRTGDAVFTQDLLKYGLIVLKSPGQYTAAALSIDDFIGAVKQVGLDEAKGQAAWSAIETEAMAKPEIANILATAGFNIRPHFHIWEATPLKSLELSLVGMAIGHSNLKRIASFPADLSIWVH